MASNMVTAEANRLLDATFGTAAYTAATGPWKLHLMATTGTATATGTEVTGGSYAAQTITMASAASASCSNSGTISFTGMPATTVNGVDITDAAGTRRHWFGNLTAAKTTGAGDTISFAVGAVVAQFA